MQEINNQSDSTITSKQLIFILVGAQIATGIFSLPRVTSEKAGQDAWIAVLLGGLIPLISLILIERWSRLKPDLSFVKNVRFTLGKTGGVLVVIIFILYVIIGEAVVVRLFCELTKVFLLPRTPLPVIVGMVMVGVTYIINKGARVIGRINELLFYILTTLFLITTVTLVKADYTNLLPVGGAGLAGIAQGSLTATFAYFGNEALLVYYSLTTHKDEVLKAGITALALTTGLYLMITVTGLLVFGHEQMQSITWPGFSLLKVVEVPIVQRIEYFFLAFWVGLGVRPAVNMGFAAVHSASELLTIDRSKYFHLAVIALGIMISVVALIPGDTYAAFTWAGYVGYAYLAMGVGLPLFLYIIGIWRVKREQAYAQ